MIVEEGRLNEVAAVVIETLHNNHISLVLLSGEMGTGKTTLVKEICRQLNVIVPTSSPTYAIVNEYEAQGDKHIAHIDLYRIEGEEELWELGLEDLLERMDYTFIEWPHESNRGLTSYLEVLIQLKEEGKREFKLKLSSSI